MSSTDDPLNSYSSEYLLDLEQKLVKMCVLGGAADQTLVLLSLIPFYTATSRTVIEEASHERRLIILSQDSQQLLWKHIGPGRRKYNCTKDQE